MRVVVQRVKKASVSINGERYSFIREGMLVLLGIEATDNSEDVEWLSQKLISLRIFDDINGVMNLSVEEKELEILLISQFTLYASTRKGNRPSYIKAARPEQAMPLYEMMIGKLTHSCPGRIQTGLFGADMQVELINDGPVTIIIDSRQRE
jgi:D-tyrosyl-tRNA(Tyr) deacylase